MRLVFLAAVLPLLSLRLAAADVIINEVMYHPPDDRDELQFIEVLNRGTQPVDLAGWSFTKGVTFAFKDGALPPGGLAVVCRDLAAFSATYTNVTPVGVFEGRLKHGGERIELADPTGKPADSVKFADRDPWPVAADGTGATLERISPAAPSEEPGNWAASALPPFKSPAGTPGRTNSAFSANLPPLIESVTWSAATPGKPLVVTAKLADSDGLKSVTVRFRSIDRDPKAAEQTVALEQTAGDAQRGTFTGSIPAQPAGRLLRFVVEATDAAGAVGVSPSPNELRPTYSAFVAANTNRATVPQLHLVTLGGREARGSSLRTRWGGGAGGPTPTRGESAVLYLPTNGPAQTFDHIRITPRQGGWKVRLTKDAPLAEATTWNVLFEGEPRWALSEALGYELFRRLGAPAPNTDFARVSYNGQTKGYFLMVEQANSSFLRRVGRDPDGNFYKLLWYGQGIVGQHEKKNNPATGHKDLLAAINGLNRTRGDAQWQFIQQNFNVETFANCYAGSMCIQNWDGFFNNYFAYHAPGKDGKWEIVQWDLDKTWGDFDGASSDYDWYTMPLNYGANQGGSSGPGRQMNFGFGGWERPPGYFSGPLLANPEFRKQFLARLRVVLDTVFTEKDFLPAINALERRLEPEVRYRAQLTHGDPSGPLAEFKGNIESFRGQLKNRRKFLLSELKREP